ncbi:universal stress protein UspA [Marinomonas ushuaiensis DSM 15871]|uniref:Universal stress protein UspA n=1 Tax=Marinomonas ushuaiensis DSM 15871 TaxID=1122207 RepID=X7E2F5_9GAMM|nr:universal stress protein [Marinomonas ushuaiensis]ETX10040.1 universal stress protein UspA [Marinomonas ushuaiensis DSM 15871]
MQEFNNIVYVLDGESNTLSLSFVQAINLAKTNQANLTLLKIHPDVKAAGFLNLTDDDFKAKVLAHEKDILNETVSSLDKMLNATVEVRFGKKYVEVIRAVQEKKYDLVIKETEGVDWLDRIFGSDDMHLLRKCPCPVWLMKKNKKSENKDKHIIAAIDFSYEFESDSRESNYELNQTILELSSLLALSEMATLHVVNAYDVPHAGFIGLWVDQPDKVEKDLFEHEYKKCRQQMNIMMEALKQKLGDETFQFLSPKIHILQGAPDRELPKLASDLEADLLVMGTVGRSGVAGVIIGNTAETILSQIKCSVLAVKPDGFLSPISVSTIK